MALRVHCFRDMKTMVTALSVELGLVESAGRWFVTERHAWEGHAVLLGVGWNRRQDAAQQLRRQADAWTEDGYRVELTARPF